MTVIGRDQASTLRSRVAQALEDPSISGCQPHTLAVSGGKGGVGKSNISLNLATELASRGHRVLLMDTDFGLSNLDVLVGASPPHDMGDVMAGRCSACEALLTLSSGLSLLLGGNIGGSDSPHFDDVRSLLSALSRQMAEMDFVIIDTRAGLSDTVMGFLLAVDTVLMVSTNEPTSILDTYRTVKRLSALGVRGNIGLVVNRTDEAGAERTYNSLSRMIRRFLKRDVRYMGWIPEDRRLQQAVLRQTPLLELHPGSRASAGIRRVAEAIVGDDTEPHRESPGFFHRLARHLLGNRVAAGDDD